MRNQAEILRFARDLEVCGVITDQTDIAVRTVAYVAQELGLPGIGYETSCLFTDKRLMREKMAVIGSTAAQPYRLFPPGGGGILRSAGRRGDPEAPGHQGSRGVQHCGSWPELERKYPESSRWSSDGGVIIERFATGREFVVEGLALNGAFRNLICGDTHYFDLPGRLCRQVPHLPHHGGGRAGGASL